MPLFKSSTLTALLTMRLRGDGCCSIRTNSSCKVAGFLPAGSPLAGQPVAAAQARWDLGSLPEEEKMGEGAKFKSVLANATLGRKRSPPDAPPAEAGSEARRRWASVRRQCAPLPYAPHARPARPAREPDGAAQCVKARAAERHHGRVSARRTTCRTRRVGFDSRWRQPSAATHAGPCCAAQDGIG